MNNSGAGPKKSWANDQCRGQSDKPTILADGGVTPTDLSEFKKDILAILDEQSRYGLAIKEELGEYYGEEVNHGRLYPNLDDLVELGLVEKSERDKRTNDYGITGAGRELVRDDLRWTAEKLGLVLQPEDESSAVTGERRAHASASPEGGDD